MILLASLSRRAAGEIYLWPLHGERRLSSSFSEFREGHYHAGIDLRSFGIVGLPCLGISDGYASRVKISPTGYGKALYLKLNDGRTAVYAHLDGFTREIDSLTWHYRMQRGESWCDLTLPEGAYPFTVGDTVCYSGCSGTSAPHLHFELRDESGHPFNPLEEIYSLPDAVGPVISGIEAVPVLPGSSVDCRPFPAVYLFRASGADRYLLNDTLQVSGGCAFAVSVWDEQGYGSYRMAPLELDILVDGKPVYRMRNISFSYSQSGDIRREYDILGEGPAGRYTVLYRKKGNTRRDRQGEGVVHNDPERSDGTYLERGFHRGEIVAKDASGNLSRAVFTFAMNDCPVITASRKLETAPEAIVAAVDPDGGEVTERLFESLDGGSLWSRLPLNVVGKFKRALVTNDSSAVYRCEVTDRRGASVTDYFASPVRRVEEDEAFFETSLSGYREDIVLEIISDRIMAAPPLALRLSAGSPDTLKLCRRGPLSYAARINVEEVEEGINVFLVAGLDYRGYPARDVSAFRIYPLSSGSASPTIAICDSIDVVIEAQSVIGRIPCILTAAAPPGELPPDLNPLSPVFALDFPSENIRKPLKLVAGLKRQAALFTWKKGKWKCVGAPAMEGGKVKIDEGGVFIFLEDGLPPRMKYAAFDEVAAGSGFFKDYRCIVPVIETGSGIDPWSVTATLDGRRMVCEWDEFREYLSIPIPSSIDPGAAKLHVEISDLAGNTAVEEFGFMLR